MASILIQQHGIQEYLDALGAARLTHKHGAALSSPSEVSTRVLSEFWAMVYADELGGDTHGERVREFYSQHCKVFLAKEDDRVTGGFLVLRGELIGLFATDVWGVWLLRRAMGEGARKLDCFDGFLPAYYAKHGWREVRRESNWTEGGPDVVYMEYTP